jgi:hypothetical protein
MLKFLRIHDLRLLPVTDLLSVGRVRRDFVARKGLNNHGAAMVMM